jgi:hypothetical protein
MLISKYKKSFLSILVFAVFFALYHWFKPSITYAPDGSFRQFGVGYKEKTILPIWLVAILMAVGSYLCMTQILLHASKGQLFLMAFLAPVVPPSVH